MWSSIVAANDGISAVIADARVPSQVLHFSFGVFVTNERAESYHRLIEPKIACAMAAEFSAGGRPFLNANEIARQNASDGLNLVVTNTGRVALQGQRAEKLRAAAYESSRKAMSSWNLRSFTNEVFDFNFHGEPKQAGAAFGFQAKRYTGTQIDDARISRDLEPWLWFATRRDALERPAGMSMAMLFVSFTPPKFEFSVQEQRILKLALDGHTDESIAEIANASLSTVKKRFRLIYDKVEAADSAGDSSGIRFSGDGMRGAEARRHLLNYLRAHPAEMRPYRSER
ncbi:MAG: hypothetical protein IAI50_22030 [Candidatus Eremiobacteraeota bacterium]|nr:hypothetical protein [Candidatus Eremiobacteraeota bacterium]